MASFTGTNPSVIAAAPVASGSGTNPTVTAAAASPVASTSRGGLGLGLRATKPLIKTTLGGVSTQQSLKSFKLGCNTAAAAAQRGPTDTTSATASTTTTSAATVAATAAPTGNLNACSFQQLQEMINKWTIELGEQEKSFIGLATKVNMWDQTVMGNGAKIEIMDEAVSAVKNENFKLEATIEYLKSQQQEFEAFLGPLEASLPGHIHAEPEREQLYATAENMDTILQQRAEDIREIIRHINDSNGVMDNADPVAQILKILNGHTDALQWVEENSDRLKRSLEDVSKIHQVLQKDQEKSFRTMLGK